MVVVVVREEKRSADENFGSPGGVGMVVYSPVKLRNNLFDYTWELV